MKTAGDIPLVRGAEGSVIELADGSTLIDAVSSWWVITHGHRNSEIMAAIREQTEKLDQVIFAGFTHEPARDLVQALVKATPEGLTRVFFSDDGSTAVEVALKMAVQYQQLQGQKKRRIFAAFHAAYHGDTVGAMSVGGPGIFTDAFRDLMFGVVHADHPSHSQSPHELWLADFKKKLSAHREEIAGVIIEPLVQGAGGMIMWPESVLRELSAICKEEGLLLIFDEVMTGFGRTGATFAMEKVGVTPDLVAFSKGLTAGALPMSVTMAGEPIYEAFYSDDRMRTFFHGHSFTANPIACAAARANMEILARGEVQKEWRRIEALHHQRIQALGREDWIADRRICGTIAAVELRDAGGGYLSNLGPILYQTALSLGVLLRPLGNVLYILPPYCTTDAQLHKSWDALEACIDRAFQGR